MGIKRLHLLLVKSFVGPFLASFSVALFILVLQFLSRYQDHIFGKGFSGWVITQLFFFASVQMVVMALPLALLLASLMTMGKLGERYELAAMKSAGINLFRIMQPLIAISIVVALVSFYFSSTLIPAANLKLYSLIYDIKKAKPELAIQQGYFENQIEGYTIYFRDRDPATAMLYDIKIWQHDPARGNFKVIYADSARMQVDRRTLYLRLTLFHGESHEALKPERDRPKDLRYARVQFDSTYTKMDISGFGLQRSKEEWFKGHRYMMTIPELKVAIDSLKELPDKVLTDFDNHVRVHFQPYRRFADTLPQPPPVDLQAQYALEYFPEGTHVKILDQTVSAMRSTKSFLDWTKNRYKKESEEYNKYRSQLHLKYALPLACIIFMFIGAPLGAIVRKGGIGMPVVISIGFFILFYTLMTQGRKMAQEGISPVWVGIWLPILVKFPMALFLTYQSATDSRLFDLSSYRYLLRRLTGRNENSHAPELQNMADTVSSDEQEIPPPES